MLPNIDSDATLHATLRAPYVDEYVVEDNPWRKTFRAGTAGSTTEYYCAERLNAGAPYQFIRLAEKPRCAREPVEADIETIIRLLKPSMSQLARGFNVSRQRIYDWRNGDGMAADKQERMTALVTAARMLAERGVLASDVANGRAATVAKFWDEISSGIGPVEAAGAALNRFDRDQGERAALRRSLASRRVIPDKDAPLYSAHLSG